MNIVFFKRAKPRQFDYKPRYYDPEKEELEQRRRELGLSKDMSHEERLRSEMRRKWGRPERKEDTYNKYIRTIIYLFVLSLLVYFIFFTDLVKNLLSIFSVN